MSERISEWRESNNDKYGDSEGVMCRRRRNGAVRGMESAGASKQ